MHKLKKYPNRRLYNATESRYVTVEDVRKLIVKGESIEVVDAKNGQDLTRSVLLQILSEQEAEGHESVLTNRVIEQLIRFYGDRLGNVVGRYIEQSVVAFMDHQDQWRAHLRQLNDMNPLNFMRQAFDASWMTPNRPPDVGAKGTPSEPVSEVGKAAK
ncbi:MAG: polyhydroxyalkanoate synthesis repressor PhaR [Gammaproteobacteria bacterium]|nr:polyhydroxyalkanoate synthesis repressor PhaR [Gammaproteobacteria bacterium]MCY4278609.1 polyhydroxyalkanoate synthesis repressor PhaR [Gammaproteobacteria bacterium]